MHGEINYTTFITSWTSFTIWSTATMNILVHVSLFYTCDNFLNPKSRMVELRNTHIFSCTRYFQIDRSYFQIMKTNLNFEHVFCQPLLLSLKLNCVWCLIYQWWNSLCEILFMPSGWGIGSLVFTFWYSPTTLYTDLIVL